LPNENSKKEVSLEELTKLEPASGAFVIAEEKQEPSE
jgi:hypothetical protein